MRYSIESRDRIYVKSYGFLSFAKNTGKHLRNKYNQKFLDSAKKSKTDVIKPASKRAIQKIGNKIADKITNVSKKSSQDALKTDGNEIKIPKKYIYLQKKRQQIIDELRLAP